MKAEGRLYRTIYRVEVHTPVTRPEVEVELYYMGPSLWKAIRKALKVRKTTTVTQAVAVMSVKMPREAEWLRA